MIQPRALQRSKDAVAHTALERTFSSLPSTGSISRGVGWGQTSRDEEEDDGLVAHF